MPDQVALVEFTTPGSGVADGVTIDITDSSITETVKAAIFVYGSSTTDDADIAHARIGYGLLSTEGAGLSTAQSIMAREGLAAPDTRTAGGATAMFLARNSAFLNQNDLRMNYDSTITNGVRLVTGAVFSDTDRIAAASAALLFAGSDMRSDIKHVTADTTLRSQSTGSGTTFEPDLLVIAAVDGLGLGGTPGQTDDATMHLGFAVNGGNQVCAFTDWLDATEPTDCDGEVRSANGAAGFDTGARGTRVLVTFGFSATGFTYQANVTDSTNSGFRLSVLAIKFGSDTQAECAQGAISASTGTQSFTGLGFQAQYVVALSTLFTSVDSTVDGTEAAAVGISVFRAAAAGTARAYTAYVPEGDTFGAGASTGKARQGDYAVLTYLEGGTIGQRAVFDAVNATGFDLDFQVATAGRLIYLGIGSGTATLVANETESISETVSIFANRADTLANETMSITESCVLVELEMIFSQDAQGSVFHAGAERGASFQGGAIAGTVEG